MERLAQTRGDLMRDHHAAEGIRRRVLEAREHAAWVASGGVSGVSGVSGGAGPGVEGAVSYTHLTLPTILLV